MKLVGWGIQQNVEYWIIENSYGKGWGDSGYFKLQMYGNGLRYKDVRVALDGSARRRLEDDAGLEPSGAKKRRILIQDDDDDILDGGPIVVPTSRADVVALVSAAVNCGNNVSEGVASTLINERGFSPSTTNFINMSVADDGLECLKQAVAVEGITLEKIVHATSKVVQGTMYDIVLSVSVTAGAKIGGKPVSNSPTKGKAQKLVQVYAVQNENNTLSFSSRIYPGKISDFDKLADSVASQASSMVTSWAVLVLTVIMISFLSLI